MRDRRAHPLLRHHTLGRGLELEGRREQGARIGVFGIGEHLTGGTFLDDLINRENPWRHNNPEYSDCERKNADSHLRGMIMGQSLCLQVRNSAVLLGTWQSIILAEFDGPRSRSMSVQVSGV